MWKMIQLLFSIIIGTYSQPTLYLTEGEVNIQVLDEFLNTQAQDYTLVDPTNIFTIQDSLTDIGAIYTYATQPENIVKSKSYQNKKDFSSLGVYAILDKNNGGYDIYYSDVSLSATPQFKNKVHILDSDSKQNCYDFVFISKDQFAVSCTDFDDINNLFSLIIITTDKNQAKLNYQFQTTKQYTYADSTIIDYDEKYLYLGVYSQNSADQRYDKDSIIHVLELVKIDEIKITNLDITSDLVRAITQEDFSLTNIIASKDIITFSFYNTDYQSQTIVKIQLIEGKWQKYNQGFKTSYNRLKGYQIAYRYDYASSTIAFAQIFVNQQLISIYQEGQREVQINVNALFTNPIARITSKFLIVLDQKTIYIVDLKSQSSFVKSIDLTADDPISIEVDYFRNTLTIFFKQFVRFYQVDQQLLVARPTKKTVVEQQLTINIDGKSTLVNYYILEKANQNVYITPGYFKPTRYIQLDKKQLSFDLDQAKISGPNIQLKANLLKEVDVTSIDNQNYKLVVYELQKSKYGYLIQSQQNPFYVSQYENLQIQGFSCQFNSYNNNEDNRFDCTQYTFVQFVKTQQSVPIKIISNQQYNIQNANFLLINDKIEIYYNGVFNGTIDIDLKTVADYLFSNQLIIILTLQDIKIYHTVNLLTTINSQTLVPSGYTKQFAPKSFFANSNYNGYLFIHNDDDILIGEISNSYSLIQVISVPKPYSTIKISINKKILVFVFDPKFKLTIYELIFQSGQFQLVISCEYDYVFKPYSFTTNYRNGEVGILAQKSSQQYIVCFGQVQQSRDYLGKLIPVSRDVDFIQMGFYYDNSMIIYRIGEEQYAIKRYTYKQEVRLTIKNPLSTFSQKTNIQYTFSNDFGGDTIIQPAIVEYDYFFFTGKTSRREDIRLKEATQLQLTYNSYSTNFYMYQGKNNIKFILPIKEVSTVLQVRDNLDCVPNNGNLICVQADQIAQFNSEGVIINTLPITVNSRIIVSRDDDQYVMIYNDARIILLLKTTQNTLEKIGEFDVQVYISKIVYFQNYLIIKSNTLSILKVDIQETTFTLTDQEVQFEANINLFVYQDATKSIFYTLPQLGVIRVIAIDLKQDTIPLNTQPVEYNILDTLNNDDIFYLDLQFYGLYATKQYIYINTNHGQLIRLKFSQGKFQVQNILIGGFNTDDPNYVYETTNYTVVQLRNPKVFKVYSNKKGEKNVILTIQQVNSNIVPFVFEKEGLTYLNYFDQTNKQFHINTVSDDIYLDFSNIEGLRFDYYSPTITNDGDQLQYSYKIQLYQAREFQSSPYIIIIIVMSVLLGGFIFYFIKQKKNEIPLEGEPLNI